MSVIGYPNQPDERRGRKKAGTVRVSKVSWSGGGLDGIFISSNCNRLERGATPSRRRTPRRRGKVDGKGRTRRARPRNARDGSVRERRRGRRREFFFFFSREKATRQKGVAGKTAKRRTSARTAVTELRGCLSHVVSWSCFRSGEGCEYRVADALVAGDACTATYHSALPRRWPVNPIEKRQVLFLSSVDFFFFGTWIQVTRFAPDLPVESISP